MDHGIALLTGKRLIEWLQVPKNLSSLPRFLQKQLQLGFQMSSGMATTDASSTMESCLRRQPEWIDAYERFIREARHEETLPEPAGIAELGLAEAKYAEDLWHRNFEDAASNLQGTLEDAGNFSVSTVSWHKLWLGYALELGGDIETATALYRQAHGGQRNIPPFQSEIGIAAAGANVPQQAVTAARQFELTGDARVQVPRTLEEIFCIWMGVGHQSKPKKRCAASGSISASVRRVLTASMGQVLMSCGYIQRSRRSV